MSHFSLKTSFLSFLIACIFTLFLNTNLVFAEEVSQDQEQEVEQTTKTECVAGQYGQSCITETKQKAKQRQQQKVQLAERVAGTTTDKPFHQPVDTSFEYTTLLLAGLSSVGVSAWIMRKKM